MRATISLLVTGLLLSSFVVDHQVIANRSTDLQQLLSAIPGNSKKPQKTPYRGSGRRELREYLGKTNPSV